MRMGQHLADIVEMSAVSCKESELNREHDLTGNLQRLSVGQVVQGRRDATFDRVLDRYQSGGDLVVTHRLQSQPNRRVRRGFGS